MFGPFPGCCLQAVESLKDKFQAQLDGTVAAGTKHGVERRFVGRGTPAAESAYDGRIGKCRLAITTRRAVRIGEVGVIENVERFDAELGLQTLSESKVLADGKIHVVEARIAEDISSHGTEGTERIGQQDGLAILTDIAAALAGRNCGSE